jgi:two-component sensor histidine kinase
MVAARARSGTEPQVNILLVDDDPANRLALGAILEPTGYHIVEAGSGDEALRKLLDVEFAVLLIDVFMPGMNGFELAELIRSRDKTASVPIVFVTGHATDIDLLFRGYRAGGADYLIKPLPPEIVRAKVAVFAELYRQRKLIEASLQEKEVLLREVHHRVKNNLQIISSLLNLQARRVGPDVQQQFVDSSARVRSIALVHERLYQVDSLASIDVDGYLHSLVAALVQTYPPSSARVEVREHGVRVPIDTAIPCGLILNELVTNALKHAYPGERVGTVEASISEASGMLEIEVHDDGVGFSDEVDFDNPKTMGLQLVHGLARQLRGEAELRRGDGTTVFVRVPRPTV